MTIPLQNWARNITFGASRVHAPEDTSSVQEIVRKAISVKAIGTRHSFNRVADTIGELVSLERLNQVLSLDRDQMSVTIGAGMRYGELGRILNQEGLALSNMASLPHITVIGACATATHGSGDRNRNLATSVSSIELVKADGSIETIKRAEKPSSFPGVVVALGALGVVTSLTLDLVPMYWIRQDVYDDMPFDTALDHFDEIMSGAHSTSLFTDWTAPKINQVWRKRVVDPEDSSPADLSYFGGTLAPVKRNPVRESSPVNCTEQGGVPGPWNDRLPHFRMQFTPSNGEELQAEYFVPRNHACDAIRAVQSIGALISPHLHVSEIRSIAADDLWLSPCYQQDSVAIHFTWRKDWEAVRTLLPQIENLLAPFKPRPHWGKLFTMPRGTLGAHYERLPDFRSLAQNLDPSGKFRNAYLDRTVI